jgi:hypothetical protein
MWHSSNTAAAVILQKNEQCRHLIARSLNHTRETGNNRRLPYTTCSVSTRGTFRPLSLMRFFHHTLMTGGMHSREAVPGVAVRHACYYIASAALDKPKVNISRTLAPATNAASAWVSPAFEISAKTWRKCFACISQRCAPATAMYAIIKQRICGEGDWQQPMK